MVRSLANWCSTWRMYPGVMDSLMIPDLVQARHLHIPNVHIKVPHNSQFPAPTWVTDLCWNTAQLGPTLLSATSASLSSLLTTPFHSYNFSNMADHEVIPSHKQFLIMSILLINVGMIPPWSELYFLLGNKFCVAKEFTLDMKSS